jgi:pSer/pThr/pTyr-binding forkhead associated (FHA) protein
VINNKIANSPGERPPLLAMPSLVVIDGPLSGRTFDLNERVVSIGREVSNDIRLDDPFVSRHHCLIKNDGDAYVIEDLTSANGTYIDGFRVGAGTLKEGSLIGIGASRFLFSLHDQEESRAVS